MISLTALCVKDVIAGVDYLSAKLTLIIIIIIIIVIIII